MVHQATAERTRFTGTPALVVEVVSTNRGDDLVTKAGEHAAAGLRHYWVVDVRDAVLDVYVPDGGTCRRAAHVLPGAPVDVSLGAAALTVDLDALLR